MTTTPRQLTVNDLRIAAIQQKAIGTYVATDRELPALMFVEVADRYFMHDGQPDLGVVLEIEKYRESSRNGAGRMVRRYLVLTLKNGQKQYNREDLRPVTGAEIRAYEGLTPEQDFLNAVAWAEKHGTSEATYRRAVDAAKALEGKPLIVTRQKCLNCPNIICAMLNEFEVNIPRVLDALKPL